MASSKKEYRAAPVAPLPQTLDPSEYFNVSPEFRRAEEERLALRSQLKRQYLLQLNDPQRTELIEDPALTRWVYARSEIRPHFKITPKSSLTGFMLGVAPLLLLYFGLKTDRDNREAKIQAGTYNRLYRTIS